MKKLMGLICVVAVAAIFCIPAGAKSGRKPFRIKVKRMKKQKTPPGGVAMVRVKVKNRTKEEQDVTVRLFREDGDTEPFVVREVHLDPKEKVKLELECQVPTGFRNEKLGVRAEVEDDEDGDDETDDEDETKLPVDPPKTDEEWLLGRDLYQANCLACHALGDRELREEDLGDWIEAVREGKGEDEEDEKDEEDDGKDDEDETMPAFPNLSKSDVVAMRKYFLDPDRNVEEPGPTDPPPATVTYENTVKGILNVSCVACHRAGNALAGYAMDTYATAFANRAAIVDSVEKNRMPTGGPLAAEKKAALRSWLDGGAPEK